MKTLTYAQFEEDIQALSEVKSGRKIGVDFSPYLAFGLIQLQLFWSTRLNNWDSGLKAKARPWVYIALFVMLLAGLIFPQWLASKPPKAESATRVAVVPFVPIEPTLVPDTLLHTQLFTKPTQP